MAKTVLLFFTITFTGRVLQPSTRSPYMYFASASRHVYTSSRFNLDCKLKKSKNISLYKSLYCFKKLKKQHLKARGHNKDIHIVLYASKKTKPLITKPVARIVIPMKKWGRLYFE